MNSEVIEYNNNQNPNNNQEGVRDEKVAPMCGSKFFNELSSLPLVKSASTVASKAYVKIKMSSNVALSYIFNLIEMLLFALYFVWSKVLTQIGRQVAWVDALAYGQLIRLEKNFPIITKEMGVIVDTLTRKYPHLDKLNQKYDSFKLNALQTFQHKCQLTKDKIEVYKVYLDVLSKHFLVQDGRSLDHVDSLDERTKIVIRRSIGNLLHLVQLLGAKFENLLVKTINKTKADGMRVQALNKILD